MVFVKAIDFAKTGVSYPVPRNISSYAYPLPYFMKYAGPYYSKLKNLSKAHSNMNLLCMGIERWERGIKYKAPKKDFNWHIMYDENIGYSKEHFNQIEEIFLDFDKFRKKELAFIKKCKNWPMFKNELSDKITKAEAKVYETNWQSVYNNYRNKCQAVCPDDRELANILLVLTYEKYPNKYKKFMWHMAGSGIMKNIKPVPCQLPYLDPDGQYEYLGRRYSLSELKPHDIVTKRER